MRFAKWPKPAPYVETPRKRAAFLTKQRREREALPLFADMIAATQHSVDEEIADRAIWWPERQQRLRDERAEVWRRARSDLFALPEPRRRSIRRAWRDCPYPADPYSLADFLHQIRIGRSIPIGRRGGIMPACRPGSRLIRKPSPTPSNGSGSG